MKTGVYMSQTGELFVLKHIENEPYIVVNENDTHVLYTGENTESIYYMFGELFEFKRLLLGGFQYLGKL